MKTIRYKNEVYVTTTASHKKCEKGTHWNDDKNQCLKLPPSVLTKHKTALSLSAKAHSLSDKAKKTGSLDHHHQAYLAHKAADKAHDEASTSAYHKGFWVLQGRHEKLSRKHDDIAEEHAKHVGRHFKDHLVVD